MWDAPCSSSARMSMKKTAPRRPAPKKGGFRHIDAGVLVHTNPLQASKQIRALLDEHGTIKAVAVAVGATRRTVERWCARLADLDLDPRVPEGKAADEDALASRPPRAGRSVRASTAAG